MKKISECAVCAWRGECKKKFSYETSGLYCNDFTRDVAFPLPENERPVDDKAKDKTENKKNDKKKPE